MPIPVPDSMTHQFRLRPRVTSDRLVAVLVTLAPLLYFFPAVRGQLVLAPYDGLIFNVPLRVAAANIFRAGYLPLWNPYIFSGMPLHASAQGGLLFPLNWFYLIFSAPVATNLMMLASYALAALGAYLYARRAGSTIAGALVTSLSWQWGAFLINQVSHINIVQTAAMLPWVLWAADGYAENGARRRGLLLALLIAFQAFAGHQQTFAYALLLSSAYVVTMGLSLPERRSNYLRSLVFFAAGVLMAAVQVLPTFELLRHSPRASATYDFFTSFSMPPRFVLTVVAPYLMGGGGGTLFRAPYIGPGFYSEYVIYVGVIGFMLALSALWLWRDARTMFWAAVAVICVVLAFGRYAPLRLYELFYHVPILNLFRVHARHLMEVQFALAVLAGRGLSALDPARLGPKKPRVIALAIGVGVFLFTLVVVTFGRPHNFTLGRDAPVSVLRAPELFLPVLFATFAAWFLWRLVKQKRMAVLMLLVLLALDLALWGQFSGWRGASPEFHSKLWYRPDTIEFLSDRQAQHPGELDRILSADQPFDPAVPVPTPSPDNGWTAILQPNIFMLYGIENAAGYDGFGLSRYSRLAGDMKVWGELTDPERTLRGPSRELDILNVRYFLTRSLPASAEERHESNQSSLNPGATQPVLPAPKFIAGERFAADDLRLPSLGKDSRLTFSIPAVEADRIALLTNVSWSVDLPDKTPVARLSLWAADSRRFDFDLRVGVETSEWAYDRADIRKRIRNSRAKVATTYSVVDDRGKYNAHTYLSVFNLPEKTVIQRGAISVLEVAGAPDLTLGVFNIALQDGGSAFPVSREMIRRTSKSEPAENNGERWRPIARLDQVAVFENTRVLPRAWLATNVEVLSDAKILEVIRTGFLPDGSVWDPRQTALVEDAINYTSHFTEDRAARVQLTKHQPNLVELQTSSTERGLLILSENFFPGWRAFVDGRKTEITRVNYNLRGVVLAPGEHFVEFKYRPASVLVGFLISVFTLTLVAVWAAKLLPAPARLAAMSTRRRSKEARVEKES